MNTGFNPKKSAQAGCFLLNLEGGSLDMYIFIKLLYLADREAISRWGESITGDDAVSMQYGPVLSQVYSLTKGFGFSFRENWEPFISNEDGDGHQISLIKDAGTGLLSKSELQILKDVYTEFGSYSFTQMKNFSHGLPEYEEVGATSRPIHPAKLLKALGKSEEEIHQIELSRIEMMSLDALLGD